MNSKGSGNGKQLTREEEAMFNEIIQSNANPEDPFNQLTTPGYNENQKSDCVGGHDACPSVPNQNTPSTTGTYGNHQQPLGGQGIPPEPTNICDAPEYVNGPGSVLHPTFPTQKLSTPQHYSSPIVYSASSPGSSQQIPMTPVGQSPLLDSFSQMRTLESFGQPNPIGYLDQQMPLAPAIQHMPVNNIGQLMYTAPGTERDPLTYPVRRSHGINPIPVINQPSKCHGYDIPPINGSHNNFQHNLTAQGGQNIWEAIQPGFVISENYPLLNADNLASNAFALSPAGYLASSSRCTPQMPMAPVNQTPLMDSYFQTWPTEAFGQSNPTGYFNQKVPLSPNNHQLPMNNIRQPMPMAPGNTLDCFTSTFYQTDGIQNGNGKRINTIDGTFNNFKLPSSQQPPHEVLPSQAAPIRLHCPYPECTVVLAEKGRNSNFIAHLVSHRDVKQAQCLVCSRPHTYKREADCVKHVKKLVPDFEDNQEFYIRLRDDQEIRAELEECGFKCSKCSTLYAIRSDVREHWRLNHPKFNWHEDKGVVIRTEEMIREDVRKDEAWIKIVEATRERIALLMGQPRKRRKLK